MATAEQVKEKIATLIYSANFITKKDDTTLREVFLRLCEGYNAASAVNAGVQMAGIDPNGESISAGDFVQLIPSWGSLHSWDDESDSVVLVPLSDSKVVQVNAIKSSFAATASVYASLLSTEGLDSGKVSHVYVTPAFRPSLEKHAPEAVALNESTVLVVWKDNESAAASRNCLACVLTVSGDTISVGEVIRLNQTEIGNQLSVTALTENKALVVFNDSNGYGYAIPLTANGTTITAGASVNFASSVRNPRMVKMTDSTALVAYETFDGAYGRAIVLSCPSTTVTKGSEYTFRSAASSDLALTALDKRRALLVYRDAATTGYLTATVLQVSGASVTTQNSPSLTLTKYGGNKPVAARIDADRALVMANFLNSDSSSEIRAQVLTIEDSSIKAGTAMTLLSSSTQTEARAVCTTSDETALVAIGKYGMGDQIHTQVYGVDINDTTAMIQFSAGTRVVPLTSTKYPIGVAKTSGVPGDVLWIYRAGTPADTE